MKGFHGPISLLLMVISSAVLVVHCSYECWGPGLQPHQARLPVNYFFLQSTTDDEVATGEVKFSIENCPTKTAVSLSSNDTKQLVIFQYRLLSSCPEGLTIQLAIRGEHVPGFPRYISKAVWDEFCRCPHSRGSWLTALDCPKSYPQIDADLASFTKVNFTNAFEAIQRLVLHNPKGQSLCHYIVQKNKIYRQCYGEHVGFHIFPDAILLSLSRKIVLPDVQMLVNLGDWPLVSKNGPNLPVFSWCGSTKHRDIVVPTYDLTESVLNALDTGTEDILSLLHDFDSPKWEEKIPKAFWRGRDSSAERLLLHELSRQNRDVVDANLTRMFFFTNRVSEFKEELAEIVPLRRFFEYKYQLNLDGTVAAYRLPFLLSGSSVVFKQDSHYYEHFYRGLIANKHFIPFETDLSDLLDKLNWAMVNEQKVDSIRRQARDFVLGQLMPRDVMCYYARLLENWSTRLVREEVKISPNMTEVRSKRKSVCKCGNPTAKGKDEL